MHEAISRAKISMGKTAACKRSLRACTARKRAQVHGERAECRGADTVRGGATGGAEKGNGRNVDINAALNEVFVKVFKNITAIEEQVIRTEEYEKATTNDMHVIEAIGVGRPKNMTSVAKSLSVTTGTLTISVNSLVKKGFVERVRSEEDRRVVLISLTEKGKQIYLKHQKFHENMVNSIVNQLDEQEKVLLEKVLSNLNQYFKEMQK